MLDKYFNYPLTTDLIASFTASFICFLLIKYCVISLPSTELLMSTTSDTANVGFTSAGFVLTFLTLLVSFKSSINPFKKEVGKTLEESYDNISLFNLFLDSELYNETIRHLKNGVKELILVAIIGYLIKLTIQTEYIHFLFYFSISGIVLIALVLWRSLLVLSGVINTQNTKN